MIRIEARDAHGEQSRYECPLGLLGGEPKDSPIRELFERWRAGNELTSPGMVDISDENPMNFLFERHPSIRANTWAGKPIREYPHQVHAINLANEYNAVKMTQAPSLYWLKQSFGGSTRVYYRLLVPLGDKVFYATRYEEFPAFWCA